MMLETWIPGRSDAPAAASCCSVERRWCPEEIMRANSTGSTHERAKANHWCHFYSVYATTQEYRTVFFLAHTPCISRLHKGRGVGGPLRISHSSRFHRVAAHLLATHGSSAQSSWSQSSDALLYGPWVLFTKSSSPVRTRFSSLMLHKTLKSSSGISHPNT